TGQTAYPICSVTSIAKAKHVHSCRCLKGWCCTTPRTVLGPMNVSSKRMVSHEGVSRQEGMVWARACCEMARGSVGRTSQSVFDGEFTSPSPPGCGGVRSIRAPQQKLNGTPGNDFCRPDHPAGDSAATLSAPSSSPSCICCAGCPGARYLPRNV